MKYKIDWVEVVQEGTGQKGPWKKSKMALTDETGKKENDVITFLPVMPGQELEGEIGMNEQYKNKEFRRKLEKPNFVKYKEASMEKAMDTKARNIAQAQDRSSEMWAKRSACELVAHHPAYKNLTQAEIINQVSELFTKIVNLEVKEPF